MAVTVLRKVLEIASHVSATAANTLLNKDYDAAAADTAEQLKDLMKANPFGSTLYAGGADIKLKHIRGQHEKLDLTQTGQFTRTPDDDQRFYTGVMKESFQAAASQGEGYKALQKACKDYGLTCVPCVTTENGVDANVGFKIQAPRGVSFSEILNPRSGRPEEGPMSGTVTYTQVRRPLPQIAMQYA